MTGGATATLASVLDFDHERLRWVLDDSGQPAEFTIYVSNLFSAAGLVCRQIGPSAVEVVETDYFGWVAADNRAADLETEPTVAKWQRRTQRIESGHVHQVEESAGVERWTEPRVGRFGWLLGDVDCRR